jgi:hypothetical protein
MNFGMRDCTRRPAGLFALIIWDDGHWTLVQRAIVTSWWAPMFFHPTTAKRSRRRA